MLLPKRTKFRKTQKGRNKGVASRGFSIAFGTYALKSLDSCKITNRQLEAARIAVTRFMKREGKVWIRIFPDKVITRKPAEVRMGKGKGNPEGWCAIVKPGTILFECDGVSRDVAAEAMRLAAQKLPVHTKFITAHDAVEIAATVK
jgi:large subunit ribosomal protein L16